MTVFIPNFDDFDLENIFSSPSKNRSTVTEPTPIEQSMSVPRETNFSMSKYEFMIQLSRFENKYPVINYKEQILDFWKSIKDAFPEIYKVASIINSIPPAQATGERVFSIAASISEEHRSRLGEQVLQNIFTIRLNKDKLPKFFENEIVSLIAEYNKMD